MSSHIRGSQESSVAAAERRDAGPGGRGSACGRRGVRWCRGCRGGCTGPPRNTRDRGGCPRASTWVTRATAFARSTSGLPATILPAEGAPTNFTVAPGDGQVVLSWDAPASDSGVTRHEYHYKTSGGYPATWTQIANSGGRRRERGRVHGANAHQRGGPHLRAPRGERRWR